MTWVLKIKKGHLCDTPSKTQMRVSNTFNKEEPLLKNSIWQCDECGQHWRYLGPSDGRYYQISPQRAQRLIRKREKNAKGD